MPLPVSYPMPPSLLPSPLLPPPPLIMWSLPSPPLDLLLVLGKQRSAMLLFPPMPLHPERDLGLLQLDLLLIHLDLG
jgi:hypothetical protein|uniref:Uncharacterized protein n=1 Tax=Picea glauca TaxID=3330 RepID=A0A117NFK2_PICGL|nr:hypothetical protein ABT39_MTgene3478 [Picea glauca]